MKKSKIPAAKSPHEEAFAIAWRVLNGPPFEREYKFFIGRGWRFDFAWPEAKIAVEIEGGIHEGPARGRHLRQEGFSNDCIKYNEASFLSWRVWRIPPALIQTALLQRLILEIRRCAP